MRPREPRAPTSAARPTGRAAPNYRVGRNPPARRATAADPPRPLSLPLPARESADHRRTRCGTATVQPSPVPPWADVLKNPVSVAEDITARTDVTPADPLEGYAAPYEIVLLPQGLSEFSSDGWKKWTKVVASRRVMARSRHGSNRVRCRSLGFFNVLIDYRWAECARSTPRLRRAR